MAKRKAHPKRTKVGRKFKKVMSEYGERTLESSSGQKVTDIKQAKAIGFSEQRAARKKKRGR